ncbi:MAG: GlxA family transcriptional regulator [Kiloniellales bacterium]
MMPVNQCRPPKRIVMLAYPDANAVDVVGPLQVFAGACRYMRDTYAQTPPGEQIAYRVEIIGPSAGPITTSAGFDLVASRGIDAVLEGVDTLLVAGGYGYAEMMRDQRVLTWLRQMAPKVRRLGSICSGAFILAAAGLLQGRRATTHWRYCAELAARFPEVTVEPDRLHVRDGQIYSSAGVTAGMDLALALLEEDCGRPAALATAREMVVFLKRPGGQSQFSQHLEAQTAEPAPLRQLQSWILDNLDADLSVEALAEQVAMSPRNFARVFVKETGSTPAKFVERARIEAARRALEDSADALPRIAERCGFGHPETMRRVFQRHLKVAPQDYRRRFRHTDGATAQ